MGVDTWITGMSLFATFAVGIGTVLFRLGGVMREVRQGNDDLRKMSGKVESVEVRLVAHIDDMHSFQREVEHRLTKVESDDRHAARVGA